MNSYGPLDRLLEIGVFLLILYEVIIGVRKNRKEKRRKKQVDERVTALREAMSNGQHLQLSTPAGGSAQVSAWAQAVSNWGEATRKLLKSYSAHAESAFLLQMPMPVNILGSIGAPFEYMQLVSRLANLRGIIEKPDIYL